MNSAKTEHSRASKKKHRVWLSRAVAVLLGGLLLQQFCLLNLLPNYNNYNNYKVAFEINSTVDVPFPHVTLGVQCSAEEKLRNAQTKPHQNSNCPKSRSYIASLLKHNDLAETDATERSRTPVVVAVGCNKGDDFILSMRQWSRNTNYSVDNVYNQHELAGLTRNYVCGKNDETESDTTMLQIFNCTTMEDLHPKPVRGFCIEPMMSTVDLLNQTFDALGYVGPAVSLIHAAMSSVSGQARFPVSAAGTERLGLKDADSTNQTIVVQVLTLSDLVREENIPKIDFLSIDTEGNDMQVILGGIQIFAAHAVRYFQFEYHQTGRWRTSSLQDLIELLDQFGYDCYWALNSGFLTRLTGCWHDDYTAKQWSNVACISRREIITNQLMQSLAGY